MMVLNELKARARRFAGLRDGSAAVEFALIAPVMIMLMLGISDLLYQAYATSVLQGAMQKAGRDSTLQGNNSATSNAVLDANVLQLIRRMAPTATAVSTRKSYPNFANVATPESFQDNNSDGDRDVGECYFDINGNGQFDIDPGLNGAGGASDIVLYQMSITYPRIFPIYKLFGGSSNTTINGSTILKNQPWGNQDVAPVVRRCT